MLLLRFTLGSIVAAALHGTPPATAAEKQIHQTKSRYNSIYVTENEAGLRILRFESGGDRQSVVKLGDPDHLELPYARVIPIAIALVDKPARVLVVGLGGGTIPSFLRKRMPQMMIDAVDIDPEVVAVAKSHFDFREDDKMRAYVDDGRRFIEQREGLYDIIFLDAFGADNIPYSLATREFMVSVKRALTPRGVVVGNVWGKGANPLYDSMIRTYRAVYEEIAIIDVREALNKIVIACPTKQELTSEKLAERARALTTDLPLRVDLAELIRYGFRPVGTDGITGRVLLDADRPKN
ncbi:MAG: methyltransferase domain-containing protein [Betaproteobacteria bacterium]|nr:methyltransferase domain-containing protein [Betaproteobacteria bacterium]